MLGKNRDCYTEFHSIVGKLHMAAWWERYFPILSVLKEQSIKSAGKEPEAANTHLDTLQ